MLECCKELERSDCGILRIRHHGHRLTGAYPIVQLSRNTHAPPCDMVHPALRTTRSRPVGTTVVSVQEASNNKTTATGDADKAEEVGGKGGEKLDRDDQDSKEQEDGEVVVDEEDEGDPV